MHARLVSALAASLVFATAHAAQPDPELVRAVTLMAKVGSAGSPSFSPDGREIAFVTNISGSPQIWKVAVEGGYPRMVTNLDDPALNPKWSPDGEWIAFSTLPGGGLNSQIDLVRPDGTGMRRLTGGGKINNWIAEWTRDGSAIGASSNRESTDGMPAYLIRTSGEFVPVTRQPGLNIMGAVSADRRVALVNRIVSRGSSDLFIVDIASGAETLLTAHAGPGNFNGVMTADGKTVYMVTSKDRDLPAFGRVRLGAQGAGPIEVLAERDEAELEDIELDPSNRTVLLRWNVAGRNELELYDIASGRRRAVTPMPAEFASGFVFSPDGRLLAFSAAGSTQPSDLYVVDVASARVLRQLTHSPRAGVDSARLVRPELVRYKSFDGLELSGWLYRAKSGRGPGAVVMSFHGGPESQERPLFNALYQAMVERGLTVFAPNVRGSSGFGKRFVNLDNGPLRRNAVKDIKATIDWLVGAGIAAPGRIGIMGGSYGGYMTMAGLVEYPAEIAAGANLFGIVNFETFFKHSEPWMAAVSTIEYGDPKTEAEMLRDLSPLTRIDRVASPTLVLHGANDTNVPVIEAEQVVESLKRRAVPVDYVLFPDEGHGFRKTPNRIRANVAIVEWFTRYLTP